MEIPILLLEEYAVNSHVMGYHDYINLWNPQIGRIYETRTEPENAKDRSAVTVLDNQRVVGHLMKGPTGRFAKTVFYFLRAENDNKCLVNVLARPLNEEDNKGMKVPCKLHFVGRKEFISRLKSELCKHV